MILVGSKALERFGMNRQEPGDIDYWGTSYAEGIDVTIMPEEIIEQVPAINYVATPNAVYTIKCSHFGWDVHWLKTKQDILWLKSKGCDIIPDLYDALVEHWKKEFNKKEHLSLAKSRSEFFDDYVTKIYDHDYLHELVAYPNRPVYEKCLKDGQEVLVDKEKFFAMNFSEQIKMFREETTVIAIERWLTNPQWRGTISWMKAYNLALQKVITSLTKGWAQDFMVLNLEHFVKPKFSDFRTAYNNLKELEMSNVDMTVFENLQNELGLNDINEMIFFMAEGNDIFMDIDVDTEKLGLPEEPDIRESRDAFRNWMEKRGAAIKNVFDRYGYEHLAQEGGGEGGAEHCYGVFKLDGKYYKAEYTYASHVGHDYDNITKTLREVEPKSKTITVYE